jgi:hypothetical protein
MKRLMAIIVGILLLGGIAYAKEYEVKKAVDGYEVIARIDRNPPAVGKNNITILITRDNSPVTDATVIVQYSMPAMPGMPPMDYKTDATLKGKEYVATMDLSMSGPWNIAIKIKKPDRSYTVKFNIDVR